MSDKPAPLVSEAFVTGEDIVPIIERIESVLGDVPRTHALIALLSEVLLLQCPTISPEQVHDGVRDISRFTCLWLTGMDGDEQQLDLEGDLPKEKMN
jgi:hypothetical protein